MLTGTRLLTCVSNQVGRFLRKIWMSFCIESTMVSSFVIALHDSVDFKALHLGLLMKLFEPGYIQYQTN